MFTALKHYAVFLYGLKLLVSSYQCLTLSNIVQLLVANLVQVLNVAYAIVALMCTFLGVAGYLMYGPGVLDVITFNLPAVRVFQGTSFYKLEL